MEAYGSGSRMQRGGDYDYDYAVSDRSSIDPDFGYNSDAFRPTLYIK